MRKIHEIIYIMIAGLVVFGCTAGEKALVENWSLANPGEYTFITLKDTAASGLKELVRRGLAPEPVIADGPVIFGSRDLLSKLDQYNIPYTKIKRDFAFREIDPGYNRRLRKGFTSIKDLKTGYKDYRLNQVLLEGISRSFPAIAHLEVIGYSRTGKPVYALQLTDHSVPEVKKIPVMVNSSHHANELITIEHTYDIIYRILDDLPGNRRLLETFSIWFVPLVNPDGNGFFWELSVLMGRKNGSVAPGQNPQSFNRGTDLNRNYPVKWGTAAGTRSSGDPESPYFRGNSAASEPETRAMMSLMESKRFVFIMSFHSQANSVLFPYTIDGLKNPEPHRIRAMAKKLARKVSSFRQDKPFRARKNLYPVTGTDQDYYYYTYGASAFLTEVSHILPEYRLVEQILAGFRPLTAEFFKLAYNEKKICLKITDTSGRPLRADITFDGIKYFNGETRSSNSAGLFFHSFHSGKKINLAISKKDYKDVLTGIIPKNETDPVHLVMEKNR